MTQHTYTYTSINGQQINDENASAGVKVGSNCAGTISAHEFQGAATSFFFSFCEQLLPENTHEQSILRRLLCKGSLHMRSQYKLRYSFCACILAAHMGLVLHHTEFVAAYLSTPVSMTSTRPCQFHLPWEPVDVTRIRGGEDAAEDAGNIA
jgi:hypothetical protein